MPTWSFLPEANAGLGMKQPGTGYVLCLTVDRCNRHMPCMSPIARRGIVLEKN